MSEFDFSNKEIKMEEKDIKNIGVKRSRDSMEMNNVQKKAKFNLKHENFKILFDKIFQQIEQNKTVIYNKRFKELHTAFHDINDLSFLSASNWNKFLDVLGKIIKKGVDIIEDNKDIDEVKEISEALDCSIFALKILTSKGQKIIFSESIIEKIIKLLKKLSKIHRLGPLNNEYVWSLTNEFIKLKTLPDNLILQAYALGLDAYFNNKYLETGCVIELLNQIFYKYPTHRFSIILEIINRVDELAKSNSNMCQNAKIADLIMHLIQNGADFDPKKINRSVIEKKNFALKNMTHYFLNELLKKCQGKEDHYRLIFEILVDDLIKSINSPDYPSSEFILDNLKRVLIQNIFSNQTNSDFKLINIDHFCTIAIMLKRESVKYENMKKLSQIDDEDIKEVKEEILGYHKLQDAKRTNFILLMIHENNIKIPDISSETKLCNDVFYATYYLAFKRQFFQSFETDLNILIKLMTDPLSSVRTRVVKCLNGILAQDIHLLSLKKIRLTINCGFIDSSANVREAAVDLAGSLISLYGNYTFLNDLFERSKDVNVSVRKKVIRIFNNCVQNDIQVDFILSLSIKRINDEPTVQKIVIDMFTDLWFNTDLNHEKTAQISKILDENAQFFEQLISHVFKNLTTKTIEKMVQSFIRLINTDIKIFTILQTFAKFQPDLLAPYISILQPYLNSDNDEIIKKSTNIIRMVINCVHDTDKSLMSLLERNAMDIIIKCDLPVVTDAVYFLSVIVQKHTSNYNLIVENFNNFYSFIHNYKTFIESNTNEYIPHLKRSMILVGLFIRHFDLFEKELPENILQDVYSTLIYFINNNITVNFALKSLNLISIKHNEIFFKQELKQAYHQILKNSPDAFKIQVLKNIEDLLIEIDKNLSRNEKKNDTGSIKEMTDIKSGAGSSAALVFIKDVFLCCLDGNLYVRISAYKIIKIILDQGLIYPVELVPYLISMNAEEYSDISEIGSKLLTDLEFKYPGLINMKTLSGIKNSYLIKMKKNKIPRGFAINKEIPVASNNLVYALNHKNFKHRRGLLISLTAQFLRQNDFNELIYIGDNLAHFKYKLTDDVLFVINRIETLASVNGHNLLESHQEIVGKKDFDVQKVLEKTLGLHLLLLIKEYLKTSYGVTDIKIKNYNPEKLTPNYKSKTDLIKKRNDIFEPVTILKLLDENLSLEEKKTLLLEQFKELKGLFLKYEEEDESS